MDDAIKASEFNATVDDWRVVGDGACTFFRTASFTESSRLVDAIGAIDGVDAHPPSIDVRADGVTVRLLTTEDGYYGMSRRDLELAGRISEAASAIGLTADPADIQSILVIPGASDTAQVMPFWQAVLGYVPRPDSPDEDLVDPRGRGPGIWFEQVETLNEMRPRMHFGVWVPIELAKARVDAAIGVGGTVIYERAPSWWTLADPEGNEADVATVENRG